jgi:hypothetical protein
VMGIDDPILDAKRHVELLDTSLGVRTGCHLRAALPQLTA